MKLVGVTLLNQADTRWASVKLGNSSVATIKTDGCLLTSVCGVCNYYGKEITPDFLNAQLKTKNGFVNGANLVYGAVTEIFPDITVDWGNFIDCSTTDAPLDKIDAILFSKRPVIVKVDYDTNTTKIDQHWITIIGKTEDGSYICNDPLDGTEIFFQSRYGDPKRYIFKIVTYSGTPKVTTSLEDKVHDLEDKIQSLNKTIAEVSLENNNLRTELSAQEKENQDLSKQISEARDKADKASWTATELDIKNKSLQEALDVLQVRYNALSVDLVNSQAQGIDGIPATKLLLLGLKKLLNRG
jgi:hypothetical protein